VPAGEEETAERTRSAPSDSELDESLEESFPSSDPPSSWAGPDPDDLDDLVE
jgi:hypothetical protein